MLTLALVLISVLPSCGGRRPGGPGVIHHVEKGENLYRIGLRYKVPAKEIAKANGIRDVTQLRPGQRLYIPGARKRLQASARAATRGDSPRRPSGDSKEARRRARESARIWQALPPVYWALAPVKLRPGAETLAVFRPTIDDPPVDFANSPAIVRQFVGAGEVLLHLTDETWRWRWRNDDRYFARYWGQAVRRLARGRIGRGAANVSTDRSAYDAGDAVQIRAVLRGGATTGERGAPTAIVVGGGEVRLVLRCS